MKYASATIVDQLRSLELLEPGAAAAAIYDQPIALRLLYQDPTSGEEHYLVRYPAGMRGSPHRHTDFPPGEPMRHQATVDEPCLFVLLFHARSTSKR